MNLKLRIERIMLIHALIVLKNNPIKEGNMFGLGAGELFLIFMIAVMFLGPKKIPELAKGIGQAFKEFEKARHEMINGEENKELKPQENHSENHSKVS